MSESSPVRSDEEIRAEIAGLSALRIDDQGVGHFYSTHSGSDRVLRRFVELAERDGLLQRSTPGAQFAVFDILDASGDIVSDRDVPTEEAWNALNSELRLHVIASER